MFLSFFLNSKFVFAFPARRVTVRSRATGNGLTDDRGEEAHVSQQQQQAGRRGRGGRRLAGAGAQAAGGTQAVAVAVAVARSSCMVAS